MNDWNSSYLSILSQLMAIFLWLRSLYIFEETCILLESPFHAELNGLYPNYVIYPQVIIV